MLNKAGEFLNSDEIFNNIALTHNYKIAPAGQVCYCFSTEQTFKP